MSRNRNNGMIEEEAIDGMEYSEGAPLQGSFDENGNPHFEPIQEKLIIDEEGNKIAKTMAKRAVFSILTYLNKKCGDCYHGFDVISFMVAKYVQISDKDLRAVISSMVRGGTIERSQRKFRVASYLLATVDEIESFR